MKKFLLIALCVATIGGANAQKAAVDGAKKLAGKIEKIGDARNLINEAKNNPETANQANTYIVAADIELKAYDKAKKDLGLNAQQGNTENLIAMDDYLLNAYPLLMEAVKYANGDSKALGEVQKRIEKYAREYWQAGADLFNAQNFPGAYNAFMIYGDVPALDIMQGKLPITEGERNTSYYNAGLSGWSIPDLPKAAEAFKKARLTGYPEPQAYIYELACWQNMMQNDSTVIAKGQQEIFDLSKAGYEKFGMDQPVFLNNMINVLVEQEKEAEAIKQLTELINSNPNPALYGLRGFVYDRLDKTDESLADYKEAVAMDNADFETILNAAKKIYRVGAEKWNAIEPTSKDAAALRNDVHNNYFEYAKGLTDRATEIANKANAEKPGTYNTSQLEYLVEQVDYAIQNFR